MDMMLSNAGAAPADIIKDGDTATFAKDVIEASMQVPVLVDFWAPWCGPCKTLGPLLEKLVTAQRGKVKLVKINVDENQQLAGQMRVQSIPSVFAFAQGRPIDGFAGALPESQLAQFIDKLVAQHGGAGAGDDPIAAALEQAAQLLEAGDYQQAGGIYQQIVQADPSQAAAFAGLAKCLIGLGQIEDAKGLLDQVPDELATAKEIQEVKTQLALKAEAEEIAGRAGELQARLEADPNDHQARYDLAMAAYANGDADAAMNGLLEIAKRDREWNEDGARLKLLELFEAIGPTDKRVLAARRKLSSLLFS